MKKEFDPSASRREARGATTPIDRPEKRKPSLVKLLADVNAIRQANKGNADFGNETKTQAKVIEVFRKGLKEKKLAPRQFDEAIAAIIADLEMKAYYDPLTEVYNRNGLSKRVTEVISSAQRRQEPVVVALFDLDYFKRINDQHGHDAGDAVLQQTGGYLKKSIRTEDVIGRWGGEEFLLVLQNISPENTFLRLNAIRQGLPDAVAEATTNMGFHLASPVTTSIGFANTNTPSLDTISHLIKAADEALFRAKQAGRNRVEGPNEAL